MRAFADDPQQAFPGQGQMRPEQAEIAGLKGRIIKMFLSKRLLKLARLQ